MIITSLKWPKASLWKLVILSNQKPQRYCTESIHSAEKQSVPSKKFKMYRERAREKEQRRRDDKCQDLGVASNRWKTFPPTVCKSNITGDERFERAPFPRLDSHSLIPRSTWNYSNLDFRLIVGISIRSTVRHGRLRTSKSRHVAFISLASIISCVI